MKKVSLKGVVVGSILDIVATNIVMIPLAVYVTSTLIKAGAARDGLATAVMATINSNPVYFIASQLLGAACSVLGGYVAAKVAKHDEIVNGALAAILCVGSGIYSYASGTSPTPLWQHIIYWMVSPSLTAFGGYLCLRRTQKAAAGT